MVFMKFIIYNRKNYVKRHVPGLLRNKFVCLYENGGYFKNKPLKVKIYIFSTAYYKYHKYH